MSKYVRTKDGYLLEVIRESESGKSYITKPKGWVIHKDRVIKQADTIKKLCDELVVVFDTTPPKPVVCGYSTGQAELYAGNTGKIYGAIWTDKGLIYVAKRNEKGELELL